MIITSKTDFSSYFAPAQPVDKPDIDLILVSQNIIDIGPHKIAETKVLLTMVGGRIIHDAR
jgi:hypothetical protein